MGYRRNIPPPPGKLVEETKARKLKKKASQLQAL